jgi:putative transposase
VNANSEESSKKNYLWKRTRNSTKEKQNPKKRAICLKYLDESGFSLWAGVTYTWALRGKQKRIERESYIKLMDWQASKAQERFEKTGKITVVVEDQGSIHISGLTGAQYKRWEEQELYIFLLPSYSSELNRIETEWQRLKEDELAGRMFEDEYELALAVIEAIDSRNRENELEVVYFFPRSCPPLSCQRSDRPFFLGWVF